MIAISIIAGVMMIGVIVLMIKVIKDPDFFNKTKDERKVPKEKSQVQVNTGGYGETKDFLPIADHDGIRDRVIDLGRHQYRALIECSSLNYFLLSEEDQRIIDISFQRFLNSLSFPIMIYVQTRDFDSDAMMEHLENDIKDAKKMSLGVEQYLNEYMDNMRNLTEYIGNSKIKKKYIVVPFNEYDITTDMSALSPEEIKEFTMEELQGRCDIIISGLTGMGITAKRLEDGEIAEVIYSYVHRSMYRIANEIAAGDLTTLVINRAKEKDPDLHDKLKSILTEAQNKINEEIRTNAGEEDGVYAYINRVMEYIKSDQGLDELTKQYAGQGLKPTGSTEG